jgi:hypothetical protein
VWCEKCGLTSRNGVINSLSLTEPMGYVSTCQIGMHLSPCVREPKGCLRQKCAGMRRDATGCDGTRRAAKRCDQKCDQKGCDQKRQQIKCDEVHGFLTGTGSLFGTCCGVSESPRLNIT